MLAWGPTRCRTKTIEDSTGHEVVSASTKYRAYSVIISGLRMSTNYSFEVRPVDRKGYDDTDDDHKDSKMLSKRIVLPTRGCESEHRYFLELLSYNDAREVFYGNVPQIFQVHVSARATRCLPQASEVEVLTGPHFGGRIAVEAAEGGERCAVDGDPDSARDTYILRIDHKACGTHVNETTVATFVIVQENLPILTHSTRRFLVLCTFQPETLTVRAGINLPGNHHRRPKPEISNQVEHFAPDELPYDTEMESVNDVRASHLQRHQQIVDTRSNFYAQGNIAPTDRRHALQLLRARIDTRSNFYAQGNIAQQRIDTRSNFYAQGNIAQQSVDTCSNFYAQVNTIPGDVLFQSAVQLVLMIILVVAAALGCVVAVWWFLPGVKSRFREASESSDDSSSVSTYENLENSLRESTHSEIDLNSSVLDLGTDFGCPAADCDDGASVVSECTNADVNQGGVFAIHLPSPKSFSRLSPEDRPCITLEHATQSEA
uniref:ZP domain-containing protein n=1 Tax=Timema douglasi TaxID=61478 RepID=A0A7R8VMR3_TIMDO|nr:unnamed protein product [Timema douglasi]